MNVVSSMTSFRSDNVIAFAPTFACASTMSLSSTSGSAVGGISTASSCISVRGENAAMPIVALGCGSPA